MHIFTSCADVLKACTKLRLTCVPPTVSYEKDAGGSQTFDINSPQQYRTVDHVQMYPPAIPTAPPTTSLQQTEPVSTTYSQSFSSYQPPSYLDLTTSQPPLPQYNQVPPSSLPNTSYDYPYTQAFDDTYQHPAGDLAWNGNDVNPDNLAEAMGELSIDHTGVGKLKVTTRTLRTRRRVLTPGSTIHHCTKEEPRVDPGSGRL